VQDSIYYSAKKAGQPLGIIYPTSGVAALPGEIGIAANSRHVACAQQFVNWVLSPAGQSVITHHNPTDGDTYFKEIIQGVTPVVTRQDSNVNFIDLNVKQWASVETELKQWFHNNIVQ
jgi:iron(III) transport system substrate-binding protein